MYNEKISVLIPARNEEKVIAKCLTALTAIKQKSVCPIEIIVCNNGSIDTTVKIVESFPEIILVHETKEGICPARQRAFKASTGTIIASLDADCIPDPDWIDRALEIFKDEQVLSVAGLCEFSNDYKLAPALTLIQEKAFPHLHTLSRLCNGGGMMLGGNVFFRRSTLDAIGGFDIDMTFWGEDARTAQQIAELKGIMIYSPDVRVTTSSRRFIDYGIVTIGLSYILAWTKVAVFKKK